MVVLGGIFSSDPPPKYKQLFSALLLMIIITVLSNEWTLQTMKSIDM